MKTKQKTIFEQFNGCKIDHDSDCAVHNEPAMPNGLCNCGLIQHPAEGIQTMLKESGSRMHEGETDGLVNAFQSGYNFKSIGADVQFLLDEFKESEKEYFDNEGRAYPILGNTIASSELQLMRHLIYKLEEIINQKDNTDWAF